MRGRPKVRLAGLIAIASLALCACTASKMDVGPDTADYSGLRIAVWDASQPAVEAGPQYEIEVKRIVEEFAATNSLEVDLKFAGRQEITDRLTGKSDAQVDLVYTGEMPCLPASARDLSGFIGDDAYLDAASAYWRRGGKILAVPAYIHWTATAQRSQGNVDAYSWDSPLFLSAGLGMDVFPPDAEEVMSYLADIRSRLGEASSNPLGLWMDGTARSLYPVTPHLWQKIRDGDQDVAIGPLPGPGEERVYFYTVPAYVVLSEGGREGACAADLAVLLAKNLGRWAARTLSCIPALRDDASIYNLESGFGFEDRAAMIASLTPFRLEAPSATEYSQWESIEPALRAVAKGYLSGGQSEEEARRGILEALGRHTKP